MFALQATRLITAHMVKLPFRGDVITPIVVLLNTLNAYALVEPVVSPARAALFTFGIVLGVYLHFVVMTVREICAGLGIQAFVIAPSGVDKNVNKKAPAATPSRAASRGKAPGSAKKAATPAKSPARARTPAKSPARAQTPAKSPARARTPAKSPARPKKA